MQVVEDCYSLTLSRTSEGRLISEVGFCKIRCQEIVKVIPRTKTTMMIVAVIRKQAFKFETKRKAHPYGQLNRRYHRQADSPHDAFHLLAFCRPTSSVPLF